MRAPGANGSPCAGSVAATDDSASSVTTTSGVRIEFSGRRGRGRCASAVPAQRDDGASRGGSDRDALIRELDSAPPRQADQGADRCAGERAEDAAGGSDFAKRENEGALGVVGRGCEPYAGDQAERRTEDGARA